MVLVAMSCTRLHASCCATIISNNVMGTVSG